MRQDTICAISTAPGKGALAVIRVSGSEALKKIRLFVRLPKILENQRAYVRIFKEDGISLDQVVLTYFAAGRSFTGEETFEISCHGGPLIYSRILQALLKRDLRLAERGEFSLRAFFNGKKDLTQAEGLWQLIESRSEKARQSAFLQMQGQLSSKLKAIEEQWLYLLSHLEADIDFSLEGLDILSAKDIEFTLKNLIKETEKLLRRYRSFESLQKGLQMGFFGPANSGKSTLFNRLLGEEKAIVTAEAGTTRDVVEGVIQTEILHLSLRDTAGLRETTNSAEKKGQEKTRKLFFECEIPVLVLEAPNFLSPSVKTDKLLKDTLLSLDETISENNEETELKKSSEIFLKKGFLVVTKKDLCRKLKKSEILRHLNLSIDSERVFYFSNKVETEDRDFSRFQKKLFSLSANQTKGNKNEEDFFVTNLRHFEGLQKMKEALEEALKLQKGLGERDLMALALRRGLLNLHEITGKQLDDKVLDNIFKKFCIGK